MWKKAQNEREIDSLSDKEENLNILKKSTNNLEQILNEPVVICQNCKDPYDPSAIFKHIGNNKECKSFYGQDFEKLKKEKNKLRFKKYQLTKQREKYASDLTIREKRKESNEKTYQEFKDKRTANKEKERIEFRKKEAKQIFIFKKRVQFAKEKIVTIGH